MSRSAPQGKVRSASADLNHQLRLSVGTDLLPPMCWRVITSRIEDQLSDHRQLGKIAHSDTVMVEVSPGGGFTFNANPRRKETASQDSRPP